MSRLTLASLSAVTLLGGAAYLAFAAFSAEPAAQHRPGHIGCPPGSHGKPWGADHGRMFKDAKRSRREGATADTSASPVADRALTAGRPER